MSVDPYGIKPVRRRPGWLVPAAIGGVLLLFVALPAVGSYNGLVDKENKVDRSFSDIDVELQASFDLLPQLEGLLEGQREQELRVFTSARNAYLGADSTDEKVQAAPAVESALRNAVLVLQQPDLRSSELAQDLAVEFTGRTNRIVQARRDYNREVTDYNGSVRGFPSSMFAGAFGFDRRELYRASDEARNP